MSSDTITVALWVLSGLLSVLLLIATGFIAWLFKSNINQATRITVLETKATELERHTNQRFEDRARERANNAQAAEEKMKAIAEKISDFKRYCENEFAKMERGQRQINHRMDSALGIPKRPASDSGEGGASGE